MSDLKKLSHLVHLIDDDSDVVRASLMRELAAWGPSLERDLSSLVPTPSEDEIRGIRHLLAEERRERLIARWPEWFDISDEIAGLEAALSIIADFQGGGGRLKSLLDGLAVEYSSLYPKAGVRTLAEFLFHLKNLKGASADYYNPDNSSLVFTIEAKRGLPISLACVYLLVGRRLGLPIEGCNLPGHFMARVRTEGRVYLVDCFDGGRFLESGAFSAGVDEKSLEIIREIVTAPTPAFVIIGRVLSNLVNAYRDTKREEDREVVEVFLRALQKRFDAEEGV
jgi:hypothetical protein